MTTVSNRVSIPRCNQDRAATPTNLTAPACTVVSVISLDRVVIPLSRRSPPTASAGDDPTRAVHAEHHPSHRLAGVKRRMWSAASIAKSATPGWPVAKVYIKARYRLSLAIFRTACHCQLRREFRLGLDDRTINPIVCFYLDCLILLGSIGLVSKEEEVWVVGTHGMGIRIDIPDKRNLIGRPSPYPWTIAYGRATSCHAPAS